MPSCIVTEYCKCIFIFHIWSIFTSSISRLSHSVTPFSGPICCSQKLPTHGKSAKFVSCKQTPKRGVEGVVTSRQISHHRTKSKSRVSNALNLLASTRVWVLQKKGKIDGDASHFSVLWSLWKLLQTSAFSRQNNKNSRCLFEMSLS